VARLDIRQNIPDVRIVPRRSLDDCPQLRDVRGGAQGPKRPLAQTGGGLRIKPVLFFSLNNTYVHQTPCDPPKPIDSPHIRPRTGNVPYCRLTAAHQLDGPGRDVTRPGWIAALIAGQSHFLSSNQMLDCLIREIFAPFFDPTHGDCPEDQGGSPRLRLDGVFPTQLRTTVCIDG
jgi:hypothetical protein